MAAGSSAPELATVIIGVFFAKDDIGVSFTCNLSRYDILTNRQGNTNDIRCVSSVCMAGERGNRERCLQHNVRDRCVRSFHIDSLQAQLVASLSRFVLLFHIDSRYAWHHLQRQYFVVRKSFLQSMHTFLRIRINLRALIFLNNFFNFNLFYLIVVNFL